MRIRDLLSISGICDTSSFLTSGVFLQTATSCWAMPECRVSFQLFTVQMDFVTYPDFQGDHHQITIVTNKKAPLKCTASLFIMFSSVRAYMMQKGCACRFLYGPGTDQEKITEIEKALEAKTELQVEVQFYRKNGKKFFFSNVKFLYGQ